MKFTKRGPALSEKDVATLEADLGCALPPDYRAFLREQNGGVPTPNSLLTKEGDEVVIRWFLSTRVKPFERNLVDVTRHFRAELSLPKHLLPIAYLEADDVLLLTVGGKAAGRVLLWRMVEEGYDRDRLSPVSNSFDGLIAGLQRPAPAGKGSRAERKAAFGQLEAAIEENDLTAVKRLLAGGLDLSRLPRGQKSPLFTAISTPNPDVVKLLLAHGATQDVRTELGNTPLEEAKDDLAGSMTALGMARRGEVPFDKQALQQEIRALKKIIGMLEPA